MAISIGDDCLINENHYIDIHGKITIGDGTWLAGRASQFFTHGLGVGDRDISIGSNCFIGSAVRFAPGSGVGDRNIVGIGSVVLSRIDGDGMLISGFPAKAVRSISADLASGKYRFSKFDWAT
jgi:acetyltransferase-like isoleucine patch superfamily enzyme